MLFLGVAIGAVAMTVVGFSLWALNYVCIYDVDCPAAQHVQNMAPDQSMDSITSDLVLPTATATPIPAATSVPEIGATATAACSIFNQEFPGTPCPPPN
jgi:hypothetical protein